MEQCSPEYWNHSSFSTLPPPHFPVLPFSSLSSSCSSSSILLILLILLLLPLLALLLLLNHAVRISDGFIIIIPRVSVRVQSEKQSHASLEINWYLYWYWFQVLALHNCGRWPSNSKVLRVGSVGRKLTGRPVPPSGYFKS